MAVHHLRWAWTSKMESGEGPRRGTCQSGTQYVYLRVWLLLGSLTLLQTPDSMTVAPTQLPVTPQARELGRLLSLTVDTVAGEQTRGSTDTARSLLAWQPDWRVIGACREPEVVAPDCRVATARCDGKRRRGGAATM